MLTFPVLAGFGSLFSWGARLFGRCLLDAYCVPGTVPGLELQQ